MDFNQGTLYLLIDFAACYMDYMDPDVRCPIKAAKINHSIMPVEMVHTSN